MRKECSIAVLTISSLLHESKFYDKIVYLIKLNRKLVNYRTDIVISIRNEL